MWRRLEGEEGGRREGRSKMERRVTALNGEMISKFPFGTIHLTSICLVSTLFHTGTLFSK